MSNPINPLLIFGCTVPIIILIAFVVYNKHTNNNHQPNVPNQPNPNPTSKYDALVFSGGGSYAASFVGGCQILEQRGILQQCTKFAGCSAGSLIAALLALHVPLLQIQEFISNATVWGDILYSQQVVKIQDYLVKLVPTLTTMTFDDLYRMHSSQLHIVAMNLQSQSTFTFSHQNTPNVKITTAVCASMCHPLIFKQPVVVDNIPLCDPVIYTFPLFEFPDSSVLAFRATYSTSNVTDSNYSTNNEYLPLVIQTLSRMATEYNMEEYAKQTKSNAIVIEIRLPYAKEQIPTPDEILFYMQAGRNATMRKLQNHQLSLFGFL